MPCPTCDDPKQFRHLDIAEYRHWRIGLHPRQTYLGRCVVILKRHLEDLFQISYEERQELFRIVPKLKAALWAAFHPDLLNYASLGNDMAHVHLHVIPRYENIIVFAGTAFRDAQWGRNYAPYEDVAVSDEVIQKIRQTIREHLK